ncbi:MAG: type II toxin-antitoxin system Phd/YefM family antitoxin [Gemmatimonadaceae bacterium]|nr:type II toxin-antitoxin system Phd/YefM family antitoxin [Gemmatimonadaceae bacterium]
MSTLRRVARIATTDAREEMAELVNAVAYGGAMIVLQRHGNDVAALVSLADLEQLGIRVGPDIPAWPNTRTRRSVRASPKD